MYSRKHYLKVFEEAREGMGAVDADERAAACGFGRDATDCGMTLRTLGREYVIDANTWEMRSPDGRPMPLQLRILMLHYIKNVPAVWPQGELSPLRMLPGLEMYGPVVRRRSEDILTKSFGVEPDLLYPAMEKLGGEKVSMGDAAARFAVLPKMPMTVVIHGAEPGLPAESSVMIDTSAGKIMHLEDLVVMAELLSHKLANVAKAFK